MKFYQSAFIFLALFSTQVKAEIAVIVNPSLGISTMTQDYVQRIFLGKTTRFENDQVANPINQDEANPARAEFLTKALEKTDGQYRSYWSRLIFTGKGAPPKDMGGDADIKKLVAENPNMVGYIDVKAVDDTVKVVMTFK